MRVLNSTFTDFLQDLHDDGFIPHTLCTFVMSGQDGCYDVLISGIDTDSIQMVGDDNRIQILSDGKDIRIRYDYIDMEDTTPDMSSGPEQIWQWRFCRDDCTMATLLFEICA